jgi:hypothetical protein
MVTISAKFENLDAVQAALREYGAKAEAEISKAVQAQAIDIRSDIQRRIQRGPKTGAVYDSIFRMINGRPVPVGPRQGNNLSATHQASAPGEAPATDTGTLVSSITYRKTDALSAEIESRLGYATMLEFGTQRMAPRPSWTPSVESKGPDFVRRVTEAIARASR